MLIIWNFLLQHKSTQTSKCPVAPSVLSDHPITPVALMVNRHIVCPKFSSDPEFTHWMISLYNLCSCLYGCMYDCVYVSLENEEKVRRRLIHYSSVNVFTLFLVLASDGQLWMLVWMCACVGVLVCTDRLRAASFYTVVQQCKADQGFLQFLDFKYITVPCIL